MIVPTWMWIAGGFVTGFGLLLLAWSLRGDGARGRRRCPKCWYQMQGVPTLRCPECGGEAQRERDLLRPRRRWRFASLALLVVLCTPGYFTYRRFQEHGWYWLLPKYKAVNETTIAGWRVIKLGPRDPDDFGEAIEIKRADKPTFLLEGFHLEIGEVSAPDESAPKVGLGEDITGDGIPDLIISDYSGGAHCCTTYHILTLDTAGVRELQAIDTGNACANFHDVDGDGLPEMFTADNAFAYWNTSYVDSPMPGVILKWTDGQYRLAGGLMRSAAPSEQDLADRAGEIRDDADWTKRLAADPNATPHPDLWREMLDLIYTGHADLAWQFLRDAWPGDRPGRMMFMVDFIAQLSHSEYWEGVRAMNVPKGMPDAGMATP